MGGFINQESTIRFPPCIWKILVDVCATRRSELLPLPTSVRIRKSSYHGVLAWQGSSDGDHFDIIFHSFLSHFQPVYQIWDRNGIALIPTSELKA